MNSLGDPSRDNSGLLEQALYQPWTQEPETVTGSPLTTEVWLPAPLMTRAPARPTAFHCASLQN